MARVRAGLAVLVGVLAVLSAACAGGDDAVEPVASRQCAPLLYEGEGEPDVIIVSDLPRRGIGAETTKLMIGAIEFVLRERGFAAGERRVGYQACNDTVGEEPFDPSLCRRNARAYAETTAVLGVIGPWNSGCAYEQIPVISRRDAGPLAMISPSTTNVELTRDEAFSPDGVRSYARVIAHNAVQGAAAAHLAQSVGARRAVVLRATGDDRDYVDTLVVPFEAAALRLGISTTRLRWPFQRRYADLAAAVAATRPDVVYLAGLSQNNGKRLVQDLRAALPEAVQLIAPDGFAHSAVARGLGAAGEGMLVTSSGLPPELLPPAGKRFVREFGGSITDPAFLGAPEAAQATEILLDAIARSDGTRASVVDEVFAAKVENGILGSFAFDRFGDIDPAPIGVYRFEGSKIVGHGVVRTPSGNEN
jgi:branched-chain amino acid transport system substrate-binding protein